MDIIFPYAMVPQGVHLFCVIMRLVARFPAQSETEHRVFKESSPVLSSMLASALWLSAVPGASTDFPEYDALGYYPNFDGTFLIPIVSLDFEVPGMRNFLSLNSANRYVPLPDLSLRAGDTTGPVYQTNR